MKNGVGYRQRKQCRAIYGASTTYISNSDSAQGVERESAAALEVPEDRIKTPVPDYENA